MKVFVYLATVVLALVLRNTAASKITFGATPSHIYPVLTKTLTLKCVIARDAAQSAARNTNRAVANSFPAGSLVSAFQRPPEHDHSSPESHHPPGTGPHHPTTDDHVTEELTDEPVLLTTPSPPIRPSIYADTNQGNVAHIESIIISQQDRAGQLSPVAVVSPYDPATAIGIDLVDMDAEGTTSSTTAGEQGYLQVSWKYPKVNQAGTYVCQVYGLDTELHPVSLTASLNVTESAITVAGLTDVVVDQDKQINELQSQLTDTKTKFESFKETSEKRLGALENTTNLLLTRTANLKSQNVQTGFIDCSATTVRFPKAYSQIPSVFVSVFGASFYTNLVSYNVTVDSVTRTGFSPHCSGSNVNVYYVKWIAIDN